MTFIRTTFHYTAADHMPRKQLSFYRAEEGENPGSLVVPHNLHSLRLVVLIGYEDHISRG